MHRMKTKIRTSTLPAVLPAKLRLAAAAIILGLLAIPHIGHAQGIVRGAQEGAAEGNRVAGPVGGVVGGAVGAGVGGAMGAVKGVFGIPDRGYRRGYRCRGYYDRYDHLLARTRNLEIPGSLALLAPRNDASLIDLQPHQFFSR